MKAFFKRYSYDIVKLYITQIVLGLFGMLMSLIASTMEAWVSLAAGVFSTVFYLFLVYVAVWEVGAKDRISIEVKKLENKPLRGFLILLIANIPNLIFATVYTVGWFIDKGAESAVTNFAGVIRIIASFTEGMYSGILLGLPFGEGVTKLVEYWWSYYLIVIPAVAVGGVAYMLGTKNAKLTKMMDPVYPESDREPKKKRKDGEK